MENNPNDEIKKAIDEELSIALSRLDFWEFCKYYDEQFFNEEREHLKRIADILQRVYQGKFK